MRSQARTARGVGLGLPFVREQGIAKSAEGFVELQRLGHLAPDRPIQLGMRSAALLQELERLRILGVQRHGGKRLVWQRVQLIAGRHADVP